MVTPFCSSALCGSVTPTLRHAARVRPEQSYPSGPSSAQMYGLPICLQAKLAAFAPGLPSYTCGQATGRSEPVPPLLPYAASRNEFSWVIRFWMSPFCVLSAASCCRNEARAVSSGCFCRAY